MMGTPQQTTNTQTSGQQRCDLSYLRTIDGALKVVQIIVALIGFIAIQSLRYYCSDWFSVVTMTSAVVSGVLLLVFMTRINDIFPTVNWPATELIYCAVQTIMYLISSIWTATCISRNAMVLLPTFLGFANMAAYGYNAYYKLQEARARQTTMTPA